MDYYNISASYMDEVMNRMSARFSPEECRQFEAMLRVISEELMPEVSLPQQEANA